MKNDEVLQATLLLSCYFNSREVKKVSPLTPTEYARFAIWLHQHKLTPADLLHDQAGVMKIWQDPKRKITAERISSLFARGASMGFALEHWSKHGIWLLSRPNVMYPRKLKEKIGDTRPPIFFGVGNQTLVNEKGIGFVGSRTIEAADEAFAKEKAELAVEQGFTLISGGAKGIDQTAINAALACGGNSVAILADSLLKASASKAYREALRENRLALLSPFHPEAGFNTGNAMARNKYIYAMSEAVVVVRSDYDKGGTWNGAKENLNKDWVPLLVRDAEIDGNQELIKLGGLAIDESFSDFKKLPSRARGSGIPDSSARDKPDLKRSGDLFVAPDQEGDQRTGESALAPESTFVQESVAHSLAESDNTITESPDIEISSVPVKKVAPAVDEGEKKQKDKKDEKEESEQVQTPFFNDYGEIFSLFYQTVFDIGRDDKIVSSMILLEEYPELTKALVEKWLKLLESEGYLKKEGRKLAYRLTNKTNV